MTKEMTSRQSWAIRCASGLDVREIPLSYDRASEFLQDLNTNEELHGCVVAILQDLGATGTPKAYKPYVKGQKNKTRKAGVKVSGESSKDRAHRELYERAVAAGNKSVKEMEAPVPMIVQEHVNPLDDNSPVKKTYAPAMGGVCGFAWVVVKDARTSFSKWLIKNNKGRYSDYDKGVILWGEDNRYNGQSMTTKEAYCRGMYRVLHDAGINCRFQSRMD